MLRAPDIPVRKSKEFDPEEFEKEKLWIERRLDGKIFTSVTPGGWKLVLGTALITSFVVGGVMGALLGYLLRSFVPLILFLLVIFVISFYFLSNDFATVEIDPERELILYEGIVNFGGEFRSTRYRGTIQIITGTQLIRFKQLFGLKSRPYIRFMTNSGYFRINFDPKRDNEFLIALDRIGLIDLDKMKDALKNNTIVKSTDIYNAFFIKKFDRSQYFNQLRQKRKDEERQKDIKQQIKREQLINKSKRFRDPETDTTQSNLEE